MTKLQIVKESIESYWDDETIKQAWNDCCDSLGTPGAKCSLDKLAKFIIKEGADNYEPFDDEELKEAFIEQYFEDFRRLPFYKIIGLCYTVSSTEIFLNRKPRCFIEKLRIYLIFRLLERKTNLENKRLNETCSLLRSWQPLLRNLRKAH